MSFRLKTILGVAAIEIFLLLLLILSGDYFLRTSTADEVRSRADTTAQLLAATMTEAVISTDLASLDGIVRSAMQQRGVAYIRVKNDDGKLIAQGGDASDAEDGHLISVSAPVAVAGVNFGAVEVGLSTADLATAITTARQGMASIALTEILLVAIFGFALGTILTRQLTSLRDGALRVASGEFGHKIEVRSHDELGQTVAAFNQMSSSLADYARELDMARRRAEERRDIAEGMLHDAIEAMPQAVLIADSDHRIVHTNAAFASFHDLQPTQVAPGENAAPLLAAVDQRGSPVEMGRSGFLSRDESLSAFEQTLANGRIVIAAGRRTARGGVICVETDVTTERSAEAERLKMQTQMLETARLESLGTLAAGIAHEINTPSQFIADNLAFLADSVPALIDACRRARGAPANSADPASMPPNSTDMDFDFIAAECPAAISQSRDGIARIGEIVSAIKEFAHPGQSSAQSTDLNSIIRTAITVTRNQWKHAAKLTTRLEDNLPPIEVIPSEIGQVLLNLIINAAHALTEAGRSAESGDISVSSALKGEDLIVTVSDNGAGIPESVRGRIFDMFFTTKAPGQGTGQGLAISKNIVERRHGGRLTCTSQVGLGASFEISLPLRRHASGTSPSIFA